MNTNIDLLIKVEGTDEYLDDVISAEQVSIYMGADVLTYSCFGEYDIDTNYEVVSRKYKPSKDKLTIVIREIEEKIQPINKDNNKSIEDIFNMFNKDNNKEKSASSFKVVFLNNEDGENISKNECSYEEIMTMLEAEELRIIVNDGFKLFRIAEKIYDINEKGIAIFIDEINLD